MDGESRSDFAMMESPLPFPSSTAATTSPSAARAASAASMDGESRSDSAMLESNLLAVADVGPYRPDLREAPSETRFTEAEVERILRASPLMLTDSKRAIVEPAMNNAAKYVKDSKEYYRKIEELNATLPKEDRFFPVTILPRSPNPACFFAWYRLYGMEDTNPTPLRSKRFTRPGTSEYPVLTMLQMFSVKFVGNFLGDQSMMIYGFIAIRDELDGLRNYVFNRSREQPHKITPDSPTLPLLSPVRGNSILDGVLVEYSLKAKSDSDNTDNDFEVIDGCIEYISEFIRHGAILKSRLYGVLGPVDIYYAFVKHGIEATVDIEISKAMPGWGLKAVTAFMNRYPDGIMLYDRSLAPSERPTSSVVAVELGCDLMLRFDISFKDLVDRSHMRRFKSRRVSMRSHSSDIVIDGELEPKIYPHCLTFTSQKYSCDNGEVVIDDKFKAEVTVTWSTMGPY